MKRVLVVALLLLFTFSAYAQETPYYFHNDKNPDHEEYYLMDYSRPTGGYYSSVDLDSGAVTWATPAFTKDTKINGDVKVTLFVEAYFIRADVLPFQMRILKVSLVDIAPSGNVDVIKATRPTPIMFMKNETLKSVTFKISNVEAVIPEDHCLGIKVEKSFDLFSFFPLTVLSPFFSTNILFDSSTTESYASIPINITAGGISVECFNQEKDVKPGEDVIYTILVYNNGNQNETVHLSIGDVAEGWNVELSKEVFNIPAKSFKDVDITVTAPQNAQQGDFLNVTIYAQGITGTDSIWLNTTIAPPEYGVKVTAQQNEVNASPGETATFTFTVENNGDLYTTYNLFVTCVWDYTLERSSIALDAGERQDVRVFVKVPENATNGTTRVVALTAECVDADKQSTAQATLRVYYETTPGGGGGGNLGATIGLALFVLGVIALLVIAYYLGRVATKSIVLECDERMMEIPPGGSATFRIRATNPMEEGKRKYRFRIEGRIPENWKVELSREEMTLESGEEGELEVRVDAPSDASMDEWASIDVVALPEKGKGESINLMISIREPREMLHTEMTHEPKEFGEGDRIVTKVKVENRGEKAAENKKVILLVNGKEKNRIEGVTIPPGAAVEIELPWIAEEENEVEIRIE
ncbi:MAG: hypothetical protein J7L31_03820 [Thermoplasmata archaeon]|nr:hypothetical protein [Thermoplasmata archaeon]